MTLAHVSSHNIKLGNIHSDQQIKWLHELAMYTLFWLRVYICVHNYNDMYTHSHISNIMTWGAVVPRWVSTLYRRTFYKPSTQAIIMFRIKMEKNRF